jgi:non-homologous end joining protein Ku
MTGQRAQWKGFIKFGDVSAGVALYTAATTSDRITFNTINTATGNRVNRVLVDWNFKLVIGRREKAVVLEPRDQGIVLWSLRFGDEVRPEENDFDDIEDDGDPDLVPLVQQLIKQKTERWSLDMVNDPIQESLLKIIAEKKKALKPNKKTAKAKDSAAPASNVINIMDALKKSLADELKIRKAG